MLGHLGRSEWPSLLGLFVLMLIADAVYAAPRSAVSDEEGRMLETKALRMQVRPSLGMEQPEYWESHDIALVAVTAVRLDTDGSQLVDIKSVSVFTRRSWDFTGPVSGNDTWLEGFHPLTTGSRVGGLPKMKVGEQFLLFRSTTPDDMSWGLGITGDAEKSPDVQSLKAIAAIREPGDKQQHLIEEAVFSPDPKVARYAAHVLMTSNKVEDLAVYMTRLDRLRQDENADVGLRVVASQLVNRLRKRGPGTSDDWKWSAEAVEKSVKLSLPQIDQLLIHLVDDRNKLPETQALLIKWSADTTLRKDIRIAAAGKIADPSVVDYSKAVSDGYDKARKALQSLLGDKDASIRRVAVLRLADMACRVLGGSVAQPAKAKMTQQLKDILHSILGSESDPDIKLVIDSSLKRIESFENMLKASGPQGAVKPPPR
jgi:hypothetical protein